MNLFIFFYVDLPSLETIITEYESFYDTTDLTLSCILFYNTHENE